MIDEEKLGRILTVLVDDAVGLWEEGVYIESCHAGIVAFLRAMGYKVEMGKFGDPLPESIFSAIESYIYT